MKLKVYTSHFENPGIRSDDKVPVAICLICPPDYKGLRLPELAPTQEMLSEYHMTRDTESYTEKYQEILSKLDVNHIYDKLQAYGAGKDVVLLCYEPPGEFCHRHLVGKWFSEQMGVTVEELGG